MINNPQFIDRFLCCASTSQIGRPTPSATAPASANGNNLVKTEMYDHGVSGGRLSKIYVPPKYAFTGIFYLGYIICSPVLQKEEKR